MIRLKDYKILLSEGSRRKILGLERQGNINTGSGVLLLKETRGVLLEDLG